MKRWEYLVDLFKWGRGVDFTEWLNAHGSNGWELVKYDSDRPNRTITATFKREATS